MNEDKIMALKNDLKRRAARKFPEDKERQAAYVWGTIRTIEGTRK